MPAPRLTAHFDPFAFWSRLRHTGAVGPAELELMATHDRMRLWPILIRFGGSRCTAPAQDARRIIAALEASGDYCRDASFPAGFVPNVDDCRPMDFLALAVDRQNARTT